MNLRPNFSCNAAQRPLPPARADTKTAQCVPQRHFRRESLYARGLGDPEDVLQHCLTLFRKSDVDALAPHLPSAALTTLPPPPIVGDTPVPEHGPLARLSSILDVGARRVLPGHLLRRSRVLGAMRLRPDTFRQRVALAARSGEESVFTWDLVWEESKKESERESEGGWVLQSVARDPSADDPLPSTPHPKAAPEAVVKAQLAALQKEDVFEAAAFNAAARLASNAAAPAEFSLVAEFEALTAMLAAPSHAVLLGHREAMLGPAALPSQHSMRQEVWVKRRRCPGGWSRADGGDWARFVWALNLQSNGCWSCTSITPCTGT